MHPNILHLLFLADDKDACAQIGVNHAKLVTSLHIGIADDISAHQFIELIVRQWLKEDPPMEYDI